MKVQILLFLVLCLPCGAASYYCDLDEADNGAGTEIDPWQWTQAYTTANIEPGDTIYLRDTKTTTDGTTTIPTTAEKGTAVNYITFAQWSGQNQAVFTSTGVNKCFTVGGSAGLEFDYCNDTTTLWSPDPNAVLLESTDYPRYLTTDRRLKVTLNANKVDGDRLLYINRAAVDMSARKKISLFILSNTTHSAGAFEIVISESADGAKSGSYVMLASPAMEANEWVRICGVPTTGSMADMNAAVSAALYANTSLSSGEVIYLHYLTYQYGEDCYYNFSGIQFTAPASDTAVPGVVDCQGSNYITFTNCVFTGTTRINPAAGDYTPYIDPSSVIVTGGSYNNPAENLTFTGCTFQQCTRGYSSVSPHDLTFTNCTFKDMGQGYIYPVWTGYNITVTSSDFQNCYNKHGRYYWLGTPNAAWNAAVPAQYDEFYQDRGDGLGGSPDDQYNVGEPILQYDSTSTYRYFWLIDDCESLSNTDTFDFRDTATNTKELDVSVGGASEIHANMFYITAGAHDITLDRCKWGGGAYLLGTDDGTSAAPITDIVVQNCYGIGGMSAVFVEYGSVSLYNNTFLSSTPGSGVVVADPSGVVVLYNNILSGITVDESGSLSGTHNVFEDADNETNFPAGANGLRADGNSLYGQDLTSGFFVDYDDDGTGDFDLIATSPAVDAGTASGAPATDYDGVTRDATPDIGAFEYESTVLIRAAHTLTLEQ